ncbi:hypothetical protein MLD38_036241 [Melastoma candidum]|uniref:Uncharacterized protein n=1 Tax=Melastoma candidum TaxID=119954 RepID=A0ACB9LJ21_9MYRT|nr:hypothetical protein MLD38_036241 [Melastoma candidum]
MSASGVLVAYGWSRLLAETLQRWYDVVKAMTIDSHVCGNPETVSLNKPIQVAASSSPKKGFTEREASLLSYELRDEYARVGPAERAKAKEDLNAEISPGGRSNKETRTTSRTY